MTLANVFLIIVLIALNGFFVGVEFAAVSARRVRVDMLVDDHHAAGQIVRSWLDKPALRNRLIAASQLGITVVSLALGAVGENSFEAWLAPYFEAIHLPEQMMFLEHLLAVLPLFISLVVVTSLHVVLGEQVPKVAVLHSPERFALFCAPFMKVFITIFRRFVDVLDWATQSILKLFGLATDSSHSTVLTSEEFKQMMNGPEVKGAIDESELEMLSAIIDFSELVVRQVCVPRVEIVAVQTDTPVTEVIRLASENAVTKMPVYEDSLEHIIGIIHVLDILNALQDRDKFEKMQARELVREAMFVPETISVNDLLLQFRERHSHIAIVLDEFGGTAGLVTLEDLLKEIVGEVQDPFDAEPDSIQELPDGSVLIEGKTLIEDINERFHLTLSDTHYDTIAGYVLDKTGCIPQAGDIIEDGENGIRIKVERMDRNRIAQLLMTYLS